MEIPNIELILENKSNTNFSLLNNYINNYVDTDKNISFTKNDKVNFIKKLEHNENNYYNIIRNIDIINYIEITGPLNEPNYLSSNHNTRLNDIYQKIKYIDFEIGDQLITRIYLENKICEIITNNYFFTIHINLKELFYNYDFLPLLSLVYNDVVFKISSNYNNYDVYLGGSIISSPIRKSIIGTKFEIKL